MEELKITKCDKCGSRILYNPQEAGWKKVKDKYFCNWCQDEKFKIEEHIKIREKRVSGIYTTIATAKPLIIKTDLKGGKENE